MTEITQTLDNTQNLLSFVVEHPMLKFICQNSRVCLFQRLKLKYKEFSETFLLEILFLSLCLVNILSFQEYL